MADSRRFSMTVMASFIGSTLAVAVVGVVGVFYGRRKVDEILNDDGLGEMVDAAQGIMDMMGSGGPVGSLMGMMSGGGGGAESPGGMFGLSSNVDLEESREKAKDNAMDGLNEHLDGIDFDDVGDEDETSD